MKNLEHKIFRQRLTVEARYNIVITRDLIIQFLGDFANHLGMTLLTSPFVFTPNESKHPLHHGIAGFVGWMESGCSIYTWDKFNFLTVEIYTCKKFDVKKAEKFVKNFFNCKEITSGEIKYD